MKHVLLATSLFLVGCSSYQVMTEARISSKFDADMIQAFVAALDDWCAAHETTCMPITIQHKGANIKPTRRKFCNEPGVSARTFLFAYKRPVIRICIDKVKHPRQLLAHELGHALTGDQSHLEHDKHIMSPKIDSSRRITEQDVDYVLGGAS